MSEARGHEMERGGEALMSSFAQALLSLQTQLSSPGLTGRPQYAVTSRIFTKFSGILDHPLSRGDDDGDC